MRSGPVLAGSLVAALALAAPVAAAPRRPDLKASKVSSGAYAHPGGTLIVSARVTASRARAPASTVTFRLQAGKRRVALRGRGAAPRLKRGRHATIRATLSLPRSTPTGRWRVVACADGRKKVREGNERNNCATSRTTVNVSGTTVSAGDLIARDLATHRLSSQRALEYRVFAIFADPRLPARYRGDPSAPPDDDALRQAGDAWPTLSKGMRRALLPYLLPPAARGSWAAPGGARAASSGAGPSDRCDSEQLRAKGWKSLATAGGKIRIWWEAGESGGRNEAAAIAQDVGGVAYPKFKALWGEDLQSDAGAKCWHGGDGAYDIYLMDVGGAQAVTIPSEQSPRRNSICDGTPSFTVARPGLDRWGLAHELFHAFQFRHPDAGACRDYLWWDEDTATWGANYAFPRDDYEHMFSRVATSSVPLEEAPYDGWVFPEFLEKTVGAGVIPATYRQFRNHNAYDGIDAALPGGWARQWRAFTRSGWNRPVVAPDLTSWDRFTEAPQIFEPTDVTLGGAHAKTFTDWSNYILGLGRSYKELDVTDAKVRELVVHNPNAGDPKGSLFGLLTLADGTQRVEDWTGRSTVTLCRDSADENVTSLVLMVGNAHVPGGEGLAATDVEAKDSCPPLRYEVLSASLHTVTSGQRTTQTGVCDDTGGLSSTRDVTATLGAPVNDPDNALSTAGGAFSGHVWAKAPSRTDDDLSGCKSDGKGHEVACHTTRTSTATTTLGLYVQAPAATSPTATLSATIGYPSIGYIDASDATCNVVESDQTVPLSQFEQTVPMSRLTATGPQTFTFHGGPLAWNQDTLNRPATMRYSWDASITIERVDESGQPL